MIILRLLSRRLLACVVASHHLLSLPEVNQYIIFRLKLSGGMTLWAPITELAPPFFWTAPINTVLVCPLTNTVASTGDGGSPPPTNPSLPSSRVVDKHWRAFSQGARCRVAEKQSNELSSYFVDITLVLNRSSSGNVTS